LLTRSELVHLSGNHKVLLVGCILHVRRDWTAMLHVRCTTHLAIAIDGHSRGHLGGSVSHLWSGMTALTGLLAELSSHGDIGVLHSSRRRTSRASGALVRYGRLHGEASHVHVGSVWHERR